jgi:hypothetical protein
VPPSHSIDHRLCVLCEAASQAQQMQQALERMNIKFHDVISDLTGVSGMKVFKSILRGERQPERLLGMLLGRSA